MNLYLAAVYTNNMYPEQATGVRLAPREQHVVISAPNVLESYHYIHKQTFVDDIRRQGRQVFLDSGAFSAWNIGKPVDINAYISYVQRNADILRVDDGVPMFSVLDGIGDPKLTWENQAYMESKGVKPLPCFHFGEDPAYLEWYIRHYPYITIGGMVGQHPAALIDWLDVIWSRYLLGADGRPRLKVHAFGITSIPIMKRYPWYSVDSSRWLQTAIFGSLVLPGNWGDLAVSNRSPQRHDIGRHLYTISEPERRVLLQHFADNGFDVDRLVDQPFARGAYNMWSFGCIQDEINSGRAPRTTTFKQELF